MDQAQQTESYQGIKAGMIGMDQLLPLKDGEKPLLHCVNNIFAWGIYDYNHQ